MDFRKLNKRDYNQYIKDLKEKHAVKTKRVARSKNPLPEALLFKHPNLSDKHLKLIRSSILFARGRKLRGSWILDFIIPHLGRFKTHGGRIKSWSNKNKVIDRKRKKELTRQKQFTKENLLW